MSRIAYAIGGLLATGLPIVGLSLHSPLLAFGGAALGAAIIAGTYVGVENAKARERDNNIRAYIARRTNNNRVEISLVELAGHLGYPSGYNTENLRDKVEALYSLSWTISARQKNGTSWLQLQKR